MKFSERFETVQKALDLIPSCPCHHELPEFIGDCEDCQREDTRDQGMKALWSAWAALNTDERFNPR